MHPDFWWERWMKNQIGFHQHEINGLLRTHWASLGQPARAKVFVPLCGKSRDMLWLRSQGHEILGIEFVRIAVRDFFAENELTPNVSTRPPFEYWEADGVTLVCGDFFDLTAAHLHDVGAVYDRASLIALPKDKRRPYVDKMAEILPAPAETLLITLSYPERDMNGPPFSVSEAEVRALYGGTFVIERLAEQDALAENSPLRARGLTRLTEHAYRIRRRRGA
jgi:thiopurine S-methyltransferase